MFAAWIYRILLDFVLGFLRLSDIMLEALHNYFINRCIVSISLLVSILYFLLCIHIEKICCLHRFHTCSLTFRSLWGLFCCFRAQLWDFWNCFRANWIIKFFASAFEQRCLVPESAFGFLNWITRFGSADDSHNHSKPFLNSHFLQFYLSVSEWLCSIIGSAFGFLN